MGRTRLQYKPRRWGKWAEIGKDAAEQLRNLKEGSKVKYFILSPDVQTARTSLNQFFVRYYGKGAFKVSIVKLNDGPNTPDSRFVIEIKRGPKWKNIAMITKWEKRWETQQKERALE